MLKRANTELISGITGLIVFAIFWMARDEGWRRPSAVWPETILWGLLLVSAVLLVMAFVKPNRWPIFEEGSKARMGLAAGGLFLWALAVYYIGFFVGSVLMFVALAIVVSRGERTVNPETAEYMDGKKVALWAAIILAEITLLYFVFARLLLVPLPEGILF